MNMTKKQTSLSKKSWRKIQVDTVMSVQLQQIHG